MMKGQCLLPGRKLIRAYVKNLELEAFLSHNLVCDLTFESLKTPLIHGTEVRFPQAPVQRASSMIGPESLALLRIPRRQASTL